MLTRFRSLNYLTFKKIQVKNTTTLTRTEALAYPALLRISLAPGLGLHDTGKMWNIIQQQGYVLTPDFAYKLLVLNEKRRAGLNVVLSGDTGVGKTEMLNLYSLAINSDSSIVADLLHLLEY